MKSIPLTNSTKFAIVDDKHYDRVSALKTGWCVKFKKDGTPKAIISTRALNKRRSIYLHRFIVNLKNDDGRDVDHCDRDIFNNQEYNLRICWPTQNKANSKKYINGVTSKYKGVSYSKSNKGFISQLKDKHLGTFKTEIEAAIAYNNAAKIEFGEFAKLNIIP